LDSRTDLVQWVLKTGGSVLDLLSGPLNVAVDSNIATKRAT
jgi:hypothetical protein